MEGVERVTLQDGWVDIKTVVTRGMRKAFRAAAIRGFMRGGNGSSEIDFSDTEKVQAYIMSHPEGWDLDAVDDTFLLQGIAFWSYEGPVTTEALDQLPAQDIDKVLERLRELYAEASEEAIKN